MRMNTLSSAVFAQRVCLGATVITAAARRAILLVVALVVLGQSQRAVAQQASYVYWFTLPSAPAPTIEVPNPATNPGSHLTPPPRNGVQATTDPAGYGLIVQNPTDGAATISLEHWKGTSSTSPGSPAAVRAYLNQVQTRGVKIEAPEERDPDPIGGSPTQSLTAIDGVVVPMFDSVDIKVPRSAITGTQAQPALGLAAPPTDGTGFSREWGALRLTSNRPLSVVLYNRAMRFSQTLNPLLNQTVQPSSEASQVLPLGRLGTKYSCGGWGAGFPSLTTENCLEQHGGNGEPPFQVTPIDKNQVYQMSVVATDDTWIEVKVPCLVQAGPYTAHCLDSSTCSNFWQNWIYDAPFSSNHGRCGLEIVSYSESNACTWGQPGTPAIPQCDTTPGPPGPCDTGACLSPFLRDSVRSAHIFLRQGEVYTYSDPLMYSDKDNNCLHNGDNGEAHFRYRAVQVQSEVTPEGTPNPVSCPSVTTPAPIAVFVSTTAVDDSGGQDAQLEQVRPTAVGDSEFVFVAPLTKQVDMLRFVAFQPNTSVYVYATPLLPPYCDPDTDFRQYQASEVRQVGLVTDNLQFAFGYGGPAADKTYDYLSDGDIADCVGFSHDGSGAGAQKYLIHVVARQVFEGTDPNDPNAHPELPPSANATSITSKPAKIALYSRLWPFVSRQRASYSGGGFVEVLPVSAFHFTAWFSAIPAFSTHVLNPVNNLPQWGFLDLIGDDGHGGLAPQDPHVGMAPFQYALVFCQGAGSPLVQHDLCVSGGGISCSGAADLPREWIHTIPRAWAAERPEAATDNYHAELVRLAAPTTYSLLDGRCGTDLSTLGIGDAQVYAAGLGDYRVSSDAVTFAVYPCVEGVYATSIYHAAADEIDKVAKVVDVIPGEGLDILPGSFAHGEPNRNEIDGALSDPAGMPRRVLEWSSVALPGPSETTTLSYDLLVRHPYPGEPRKVSERTRLEYDVVKSAEDGPHTVYFGQGPGHLEIHVDQQNYIPPQLGTATTGFRVYKSLERAVFVSSSDFSPSTGATKSTTLSNLVAGTPTRLNSISLRPQSADDSQCSTVSNNLFCYKHTSPPNPADTPRAVFQVDAGRAVDFQHINLRRGIDLYGSGDLLVGVASQLAVRMRAVSATTNEGLSASQGLADLLPNHGWSNIAAGASWDLAGAQVQPGRWLLVEVEFVPFGDQDPGRITVSPTIDELVVEYEDTSLVVDAYVQNEDPSDSSPPDSGTPIGRYPISVQELAVANEPLHMFPSGFSTHGLATGTYQARAVLRSLAEGGRIIMTSNRAPFTVGSPANPALASTITTDRSMYEPGQVVHVDSVVQALPQTPRLEHLLVMLQLFDPQQPSGPAIATTSYEIAAIQGPAGSHDYHWDIPVTGNMPPLSGFRVAQTVTLLGEPLAQADAYFGVFATNLAHPHLSGTLTVSPPRLPDPDGKFEGFDIDLRVWNDGNLDLNCVELSIDVPVPGTPTAGPIPSTTSNFNVAKLWVGALPKNQSLSFWMPFSPFGSTLFAGNLAYNVELSAVAHEFNNLPSDVTSLCAQGGGGNAPPLALAIGGFYLGAIGSGGGGASNQRAYVPFDLGTLTRNGVLDEFSEPLAMNAAGDIVGHSWGSAGSGRPDLPVLWRCHRIRAVPLPAGAVSGVARAINEEGIVAGEYLGADGYRHGFYWLSAREDTAAQTIPLQSGFTETGEFGLNNQVGNPLIVGEQKVTYSGQLQSAQTLAVVPPATFLTTDTSSLGGIASGLIDVNDRRDVIGWYQRSGESYRRCFTVQDGSTYSTAVLNNQQIVRQITLSRLNAVGTSVGTGLDSSGASFPVVARGPMGVRLPGPGLQPIAGGAFGLTSQGLIVGYAIPSGGSSTACRWRNGNYKAFADQIPQCFMPTGMTLERAAAANDAELVACSGVWSSGGSISARHAVVLEPLPLTLDYYNNQLLAYSRSDVGLTDTSTDFSWLSLGCAGNSLKPGVISPPLDAPAPDAPMCCTRPSLRLGVRPTDASPPDPRPLALSGPDVNTALTDFAFSIAFSYAPQTGDPSAVLLSTREGSSTTNPYADIVCDNDALELITHDGANSARIVLGSARVGRNVLVVSLTPQSQSSGSALAFSLNGAPALTIGDLKSANPVITGSVTDGLFAPTATGFTLSGGAFGLMEIQAYKNLGGAAASVVESLANSLAQTYGIDIDPHPEAIAWFSAESALAYTQSGSALGEWSNSAVRPRKLTAASAQYPTLATTDLFGPACRPAVRFTGGQALVSADTDPYIEAAVVLDRSKSMDTHTFGSLQDPKRIDYARAIAGVFADALLNASGYDGNDRLRLILLGSDSANLLPQSADYSTVDAFVSDMAGVEILSGTPYGPALKVLGDPPTFLHPTWGHLGLVLSDGGANDSGRDSIVGYDPSGYARGRDLLLAPKYRVVVSTVGINEPQLLTGKSAASSDSRDASTLLADLALSTGGSYTPFLPTGAVTSPAPSPASVAAALGDFFRGEVIAKARGQLTSATATIVFALPVPAAGSPVDTTAHLLLNISKPGDTQGVDVIVQHVVEGNVSENRLFCTIWKGSQFAYLVAPVSLGEPHCLQLSVERSADGTHASLSGSLDGSALGAIDGSPAVQVDPIVLNALHLSLCGLESGNTNVGLRTGQASGFVGANADLAELIVDPRALSAQELAAQRLALARKYHIRFPQNLPPVAVIAPISNPIPDRGWDGVEDVVLDGTRSFDPDGVLSETAFAWYEGTNLLSNGSRPRVRFATGVHSIRLEVTDSGGLTDTAAARVDVEAPPQSIVLSYPFDDANPDGVTDSSGNGLDGKYDGNAHEYTYGREFGGVQLTGSTLVDLGSAAKSGALPSGATPRTIMAWCVVPPATDDWHGNANSAWRQIYLQGGGTSQGNFALWIGGLGAQLEIGTETLNFYQTLSPGWHHIAAVVPVGAVFSQQCKVYLDGVRVHISGGPASANPLQTSADRAMVGPPASVESLRFDDIRIYAQEFSDDRIAEVFSAVPVNSWPCDESDGDTCHDRAFADQSLGNPLALHGAGWDSDPDLGKFVRIADGSQELASSNKLDGISDNWSVSAWVRFNTIPDNDLVPLFWQDSPDGPLAWLEANSGCMRTHMLDGEPLKVGAHLNDQQWHHIALTFSASDKALSMWMDGEALADNFDADTLAPLGNTLHIGGNPTGDAFGFDGGVLRVHLYQRALTKDDVYSLYKNRR
jgi:hypothetical protein